MGKLVTYPRSNVSLDLDIVDSIRARVEEQNCHDWLDASFVGFSMTPSLNVVHNQVSREKAGRAVLVRQG
jgi:hypothetical protein